MKRLWQSMTIGLLIVGLLIAIMNPEKAEATSKIKIALLLPGSISDAGWNAHAYEGLMKLKEQGYDVAFTEGIPIANIEEAFRNYAQRGYDLIIGHGFEFGEPALRVAARYPDTKFFVSGKVPPNVTMQPNVGFMDQKEYEGAYLCGIVAGLMTKTDRIGYIGGLEIPTQLANFAAFTKAVEAVNPEAKVLGIITGTFEDPAKGKEAALAQIDNGADIIMQTADSTGMGAIEAAKAQNVYIIGYGGDQHELAPDLCLTSLVINISEAIAKQVDRIKEGTFGGIWYAGIAEGIIDIAPYHNLDSVIPQEVKDKVAGIREDIIEGEFTVPEIYERIDKN